MNKYLKLDGLYKLEKMNSLGLARKLEGCSLDSLADDDYNAIVSLLVSHDLSKPLKYRGN